MEDMMWCRYSLGVSGCMYVMCVCVLRAFSERLADAVTMVPTS